MAQSSKTKGAKKHVKIEDLPTSEKELTQDEAKKVKGGWQGPITTPSKTNTVASKPAANNLVQGNIIGTD